MTKIQTGKLRYLNIAPRKVRFLAATLKGLPVNEAEAQLLLRPQRSAPALLKLLRSTLANAKNNTSLSTERLMVKNIIVDGAPALARFRARAQGRGARILKHQSHITLILEEKDSAKAQRFLIPQKEKKTAKTAKKATVKAPKKAELRDEEKKGAQKGLLKRMFRRKSV
ncbi:MAG: 50S ribosomal protein L22 [Candidatus Harrisonbacteria bacterium]|nr:50S ribosomal protein L22 [Candidatus Harrisonbacteria bacterium]